MTKYHHCSRMRRLIEAREKGESEEQAEPFYINLPGSQRLNYSAIANEIVAVQPMPMPTGAIFFLDSAGSAMKEHALTIDNPSTWRISGYPTLWDPEQTDDFTLFTEDMFQLTPVLGGFCIDVGWYPDGDVKNGLFRGVLVSGGDWDNPEAKFETRDPANMLWWVELVMRNHKPM